MRFKVWLDAAEYRFEVIRQGDRLRVRVDDAEPVELLLTARDAAMFALQHGAQQIHAAGYLEGSERQLWVDGALLNYERVEARQRSNSAETGSLSATIPAIVTQILVQPGDHVALGDNLILLESMKMVIPIRSPYDGAVRALHCAVGDAVQPGVPLIAVEANT